ncbi:hypothetical protein ACFQ1E_10535 [Sphingomonas canadensis]|uniref:Uncharacterized protein n=1 Tax=Sphingomonas canadensis TaxID=1219257 RepID=A0ABW3H654_9SPHN|nr:hypothetical protein [Sphingomonas canadensis]MCW3836445.1 hypothetical protein [Sphingomonas canadensis]
MRRTIAPALALLALAAIAAPALAVAPHSGAIATRSMPELSDFLLFAVAVAGVWLARRALRARFRRIPKD